MRYGIQVQNKIDRLTLIITKLSEVSTQYNNPVLEQLIQEAARASEAIQNFIELEVDDNNQETKIEKQYMISDPDGDRDIFYCSQCRVLFGIRAG